jgi:hypothetical protein
VAPKADEMPSYWRLIAPVAKQAWKAWDSKAAFAATVLFAILTRFIALADRATVAREMITLGAPIAVALIAILVAGFALFSSLVDVDFRKAMGKNMPYVSAAFLYSITIASLALIADVLLFAGSFIDSSVRSWMFWWVSQLAFFGFAYTVTVASYELTIILIGRSNTDLWVFAR